MDDDFYNWCLQRLDYLQNVVDPIVITSELLKKSILTEVERRFIFRLKDRKELWYRLLTILKSRCPFGRFLDALEECGYAIRMNRDQLEAPDRTDCQNSSRQFAQRLLVNLKMQTHNAVFTNPREYLHELSITYYKKFLQERDEYRKQMIADRYASVICAEIDSYIMLYKENETTMKKIRKLKALIPHTTNSCVTNVAYNARMAIASSVAGKFDEAENFLQSSKMDSFNLQACVEVENMLYIEVFSLLSKYEKEPSIELRDKILIISDNGLQFLEDEDEFSRLFWRRMFLIRMTYCLFGLSMKFQRIPGCYIDQDAIYRGKRYLAEIDKCWDGIESRRKIWYYVARARQYELECDMRSMETAIWFVDQAIDIATNGNFSEIDFAIDYKNGLLSQKEILESERDATYQTFLGQTDLGSEPACESEDQSSDLNIEHTSWQSRDSVIGDNASYAGNVERSSKSIKWNLHDMDTTLFNKKTKSYLESLMKENNDSNCVVYSIMRSSDEIPPYRSDLQSFRSWRRVNALSAVEHLDSRNLDNANLSLTSGLSIDDDFQSFNSKLGISKEFLFSPHESYYESLQSQSFNSNSISKTKSSIGTKNVIESIHPSLVEFSSKCDNDPVENSFDFDDEYLNAKLHILRSEITSRSSCLNIYHKPVKNSPDMETKSLNSENESELICGRKDIPHEPVEHSIELSYDIHDLSMTSLVFDRTLSFGSIPD